MSGRKLARRACDACKIRKIKCTETSPCEGCKNANIPCTWLKQAQPRGPRRLREATLQEIRKAQDILQTQSRQAGRRGTTRSANVADPDPPPEPSSEIGQLVLYLCVYRVQLYPIWPVIKVERLIASLQSERPDVEVYALAYALAAATACRTESTELSISRRNHAQILEAKCQAARAKVPHGRPPNLTTVRIAFFLHIYYESMEANSMKSMLYLREALTIATMIGLHKESYYSDVPVQEREIRRRVLWLLFVTERVVSVLYENTPSTLRTKIELPSTADTDEVDILAGFQALVTLFWKLDECGMFRVLDELDVQASPGSNIQPTFRSNGADFSDIIQASAVASGYIPPVQALDLAVSRSWLQVMNWRIQQAVSSAPHQKDLENFVVATESMIEVIEGCSYALIEVHGFLLQLRLSIILGATHELLASDPAIMGILDARPRIEACSSKLNKTFRMKTGKDITPSTSIPPSVRALSDRGGSAVSPASMQHHQSPQNFDWQEAVDSDHVMPSYLGEDFAANHNYEGLFAAVELAGVQSSDTVEDLFSHTHLSQYSTFDDPWLGNIDGGFGTMAGGPRAPGSMFDNI